MAAIFIYVNCPTRTAVGTTRSPEGFSGRPMSLETREKPEVHEGGHLGRTCASSSGPTYVSVWWGLPPGGWPPVRASVPARPVRMDVFLHAVRISGAAGLVSACSCCSPPARRHITPRACGDTAASHARDTRPPVSSADRESPRSGCRRGAGPGGGLFGCFRWFETEEENSAQPRRPLFKTTSASTIAQPPLLPRLNGRRSGGEPQTEGGSDRGTNKR